MRRFAALTIMAVAGLAAGCGEDATDESATSETSATTTATSTGAGATTQVFEIEARGGAVVGGSQDWTVTEGETVTLQATSDESEELHVHGFDLVLDLEPGTSGTLSFDANLTGVFEVEMHKSGEAGTLRVNPA